MVELDMDEIFLGVREADRKVVEVLGKFATGTLDRYYPRLDDYFH